MPTAITNQNITFAAKCAPEESILESIGEAGLVAVELYTSPVYLYNLKEISQICKKFSFRYAVHAPNDGKEWNLLAEMVDMLNAEVVVFHNIYWDDEWDAIIKSFEGIDTKLCMENTYSMLESLKFTRKYGIGICMDIEHLQIECAGFFEEAAVPFIKRASHIHLTGYTFGSKLWHTHLHYSPEHNMHLLNLIEDAGFSGLIVSEAKISLQTLSEFKRLNAFITEWQSQSKGKSGIH